MIESSPVGNYLIIQEKIVLLMLLTSLISDDICFWAIEVILESFLLTIGVTFNGLGHLLYLLTNISDWSVSPVCTLPVSGMSNFFFLMIKARRRVFSVNNITQLDRKKITESVINFVWDVIKGASVSLFINVNRLSEKEKKTFQSYPRASESRELRCSAEYVYFLDDKIV